MRLLILAGALLACAPVFAAETAQPAAAATVPLDTFIKHHQFIDAKISPGGEYLAASVRATEDTGALVVLKLADMKMFGNFKLRGKTFVDDFEWVNANRLVFSVAESAGSKSTPRGTGELYGMDADGRNQSLLMGPRKEGGIVGDSNLRVGFLVDALHDDDKFALVWTRGVGNDEGDYHQLARMNVNTGKTSIVARAPVLNASFLADHEQRARFVWGEGTDVRQRAYYRAPKGGDWELINDESRTDQAILPLAFSRDGNTVYMQVTEAQGPDGLYAWDVATRKRTLLVRDDDTDPMNLVFSFDGKQPYGVVFMDGTPRLHPLDAKAPEFQLRKALSASFPDSWISITSATKDEKKIVFRVWSDRNPGEYYLFDRDAKKATYLLSSAQWIDPERMASMQPITYKARDGLVIHGYLTLPPGSDGKGLPLILNPHGGPIGPFDRWGFNSEVQLFASRGYAVLQVNYRGSGNYGRAFARAGYRQWGDKMIDDMTDAVNWAVAQGIADRDRVCIYGASYGGYAAAQAIVREPDLYRCSVGYVGVYDMPMMYTYGDIPDSDTGTNFLKEALGGGSDFLTRISPTRNAAAIKTPMFIAVGNDDIRAHPKHSRAMRDALEKAGKSVEWLEKDYEGHGYFKEENNRELYTRMLAFFDRYIGPDAKGSKASGAN
jgi:dipeptidyl aminopeptidase/acylaminoacyl peptidase